MAVRALHSDPTLGECSWLATSNCPIFRSTAVFPSEAAQSPWQSKVGVLDLAVSAQGRICLMSSIYWGVGKGSPVGLVKTFSESHHSLRLFLTQVYSPIFPISPLSFTGISPNKSLVPNPVLEFASQKTWTGVFSCKTLCFFIFRALTTIFNCIMFNCSAYLLI